MPHAPVHVSRVIVQPDPGDLTGSLGMIGIVWAVVAAVVFTSDVDAEVTLVVVVDMGAVDAGVIAVPEVVSVVGVGVVATVVVVVVVATVVVVVAAVVVIGHYDKWNENRHVYVFYGSRMLTLREKA